MNDDIVDILDADVLQVGHGVECFSQDFQLCTSRKAQGEN